MAKACGSAAGSISSRSAVPKRLSASSACARRRAELVREIRRLARRARPHLHDQLAAAAEHGERGIHEHRRRLVEVARAASRNAGDRSEPLERRRRAAAGRRARAGPARRRDPGTGG